MKKIIYFVTILATFVSCYSRKEKTEINNSNNTDSIKNTTMQTTDSMNNKVKRDIVFNVMSTTKVTSEFERLDMELFHQCMEESRANGMDYTYKKRLDSGIEIMLDGGSEELIYQETHPDSYFSIFKIYDSRGYIMEKGLLITKSFSTTKMGTWYYYDETGKLINETNYDKHYRFTFNDVLEFCKKERIPVTKGIDFPTQTVLNNENEPVKLMFVTEIDRGYTDTKSWWLIIYYNGYSTERTDIHLDGQTGKVLSRDSGLIAP